jgi:hypothetical protein
VLSRRIVFQPPRVPEQRLRAAARHVRFVGPAVLRGAELRGLALVRGRTVLDVRRRDDLVRARVGLLRGLRLPPDAVSVALLPPAGRGVRRRPRLLRLHAL